jgi:hypothetical protein
VPSEKRKPGEGHVEGAVVDFDDLLGQEQARLQRLLLPKR